MSRSTTDAMVVVDGVRYREDDARRRGLLADKRPPAAPDEDASESDAKPVANKARRRSSNKARQE